MSTERIYTSSAGPITAGGIPACSTFTFLFPSDDSGASTDPFPSTAPAFIDAASGRTLTRGTTRRLALELAWGLTHVLPALAAERCASAHLRLHRGDTLLIFAPNTLAFPLALYGAIAAGLRVTLANAAHSPAELAHQFVNSQAKVVFAYPALVPVARAMMCDVLGMDEGEAEALIVVADWEGQDAARLGEEGRAQLEGLVCMDDLLGQGQLLFEERFDGSDADETAYLSYSSGTTGKPKGIMTTHRNLIANVIQMDSSGVTIQHGQDVHLGFLPLFHIYALNSLLHHAFLRGVPVVLMPRFEMIDFLRAIATHRTTIVYLVPPVILGLLHHPATASFDLSSLRTLVSAAAPLSAQLVTAAEDKMRSLGAETAIVQGHGLTESSPTLTILPTDDSRRKAGSVGLLMPSLEARLVLDDDTDALEGERGELWVRGPNIMKGYWRNGPATRDAITPDGWFKTGDVAERDDEGYFYIVDRKKELIRFQDHQLAPAELESALLLHPEVVDAAVIGIPHPKYGEVPRAYIVPAKKLPGAADERAFAMHVDAWLRTRVAEHQAIRGGVVVVAAIPKSAAGKILRRTLRDQAAREAAVAVAADELADVYIEKLAHGGSAGGSEKGEETPPPSPGGDSVMALLTSTRPVRALMRWVWAPGAAVLCAPGRRRK